MLFRSSCRNSGVRTHPELFGTKHLAPRSSGNGTRGGRLRQRQLREPELPLNDHPKKQVLEKLIVPQPDEQGPTPKLSGQNSRIRRWYAYGSTLKKLMVPQPAEQGSTTLKTLTSCLNRTNKGFRNSGVRTHPGLFGTMHLALCSAELAHRWFIQQPSDPRVGACDAS